MTSSRIRFGPVVTGAVLGAAVVVLFATGCADRREASALAARAARSTSTTDARAGWLRITARGIERLSKNAGANAGATPGTSRTVRIPSSRQGDFSVCTRGECSVDIQITEALASIAPEASLALGLGARVRSSAIPVRFEQSWACAFTGRPECNVTVDSSAAGSPVVAARALVRLELDPSTRLVQARLGDVGLVQGFDESDVRVAGANTCGSVWCSVANLPGAATLLNSQVEPAVTDLVRSEIEGQLCVACESGCPTGATCVSGVCRDAGGCVSAPVGLGAVIAAPDRTTQVYVAIALGDEIVPTPGGIDVGLRVHAAPSEVHRCVPRAEAPDPIAIPEAVLSSRPDRGDLRAAVGERALERVFWALWQAGVGCLEVGESDLPIVRTLVPGIAALRDLGAGSPRIRATPIEAPSLRLEGNGGKLSLVVRLDLEAVVDRRIVRLAAGDLSVRVPLSIDLRQGTLLALLDSARAEVEVERVWRSPLLDESAEALRDRFAGLGAAGVAFLPAEVSLGTLPAELGLARVGDPETVEVGETRALVIDLELRR
jgi:hypothetical protein